MRDCRRNQSTISYSLYGVSDVKDEFGNTVKGYGEKQSMRLCAAPVTGEVSMAVFGADLNYDKILSTHDKMCKIDEFSKIWIDGSRYQVKKVAKNLNVTLIAVERVEVSEDE